MTQLTALRDLLAEYRSRMNLDGSSNVLVSKQDVRQTVLDVCKASYLTYIPSITVASGGSTDAWPYQEEQFTHIISSINNTSRDSLQHLKWIQFSLRYKGIAILDLGETFQRDQADLVSFVENASFERGRIRIVEKTEGTSTRLFVIAMKWDLLCA